MLVCMRPQGAEEVLEGSPTQWSFQREEKIAASAMKLLIRLKKSSSSWRGANGIRQGNDAHRAE